MTRNSLIPAISFDEKSPRLTDSQESLLEDEERLDALLLEATTSPTSRKNVTFSDVVQNSPRPLLRTSSSYRLRGCKSILKKEDKHRESIRRLLEYAGERLYKDLCMLVEERDRVVAAIELTPSGTADMSPDSAQAHINYRDQLLQNKGKLDTKIDGVWRKLKNAPIDFVTLQCAWIFAVPDSALLTMKSRPRRIAIIPRKNSFITIDRKKKSDIELASEYAQKLAKMRLELIRKDSEHEDEGYLSLLQRVSRTLGSHDALHLIAKARDIEIKDRP